MKKKLAFWCPIFFWFPRVIKKYIPPPYPSGPFNYWIYNPEYLCSGRKGQLLCEGIFQGQNDLCLSGNTSYLSIHLPIDQFNQFINNKLMKSIFKVKSIQLIKSINNAAIYDSLPFKPYRVTPQRWDFRNEIKHWFLYPHYNSSQPIEYFEVKNEIYLLRVSCRYLVI